MEFHQLRCDRIILEKRETYKTVFKYFLGKLFGNRFVKTIQTATALGARSLCVGVAHRSQVLFSVETYCGIWCLSNSKHCLEVNAIPNSHSELTSLCSQVWSTQCWNNQPQLLQSLSVCVQNYSGDSQVCHKHIEFYFSVCPSVINPV